MWFFSAFIDWLNLPVSIPLPHDFQAIFFPKFKLPWVNDRDRKIYTDCPYREEEDIKGGERIDPEFCPSIHRKYNAEFCYKNEKEEQEALTKCIEYIQKKLESKKKLNANPNVEAKMKEELTKRLDILNKRSENLNKNCVKDPHIEVIAIVVVF